MLALLLSLAAITPDSVPPPAPPTPPIFTPPPALPAPPVHLPVNDSASFLRLFSADDYPAEAMRLEQQGTVGYRATVGIDGRVVSCEVMASSGSASLDAATCSIIQRRARFRPALDERGRPVEDRFSGRVRWALPKLEPTAFADQRVLAIFTTDGAGSVVNCRLQGADSGPSGPQICATLSQTAQQIITGAQLAPAMAGQELVLEQGLLVGGPDAANFIGQASGERLIKRAAFALTIDGLGKVIDCVAVGYGADVGSAAQICEHERRRRFSPLDAGVTNQTSRHAVRYIASYTRTQR